MVAAVAVLVRTRAVTRQGNSHDDRSGNPEGGSGRPAEPLTACHPSVDSLRRVRWPSGQALGVPRLRRSNEAVLLGFARC
jgi:hypothetical protein